MPRVPFASNEEAVEIEKELARRVLGPVYRETRVSMPVSLFQPSATPPPDPGQDFSSPGDRAAGL